MRCVCTMPCVGNTAEAGTSLQTTSHGPAELQGTASHHDPLHCCMTIMYTDRIHVAIIHDHCETHWHSRCASNSASASMHSQPETIAVAQPRRLGLRPRRGVLTRQQPGGPGSAAANAAQNPSAERKKERSTPVARRVLRGHELGSGHRTYLCLVIQGSLIYSDKDILSEGYTATRACQFDGVTWPEKLLRVGYEPTTPR
jgi:hypothetical protein